MAEARRWYRPSARAKLLRIAANLASDDCFPHEVNALIAGAKIGEGEGHIGEKQFRAFLGSCLSWGKDEIDEAVEEVYREAERKENPPNVGLAGLAEREFRSFWEGQRATVPLNEPARARDEELERVLRSAFLEGWRRRGLQDDEWRDAPLARSE